MSENERQEDAETAVAVESTEGESSKLAIEVVIDDVGPCRKHVQIKVPRADLDRVLEDAIDELAEKAEVPGFRHGHAPKQLLGKRFKKELADELKQKVLMQSLEQVSEDHDLEPIDEPDIDVAALEIPEEGDFEYEFEVEVRPEFDLPDYASFTLDRPSRDIGDTEIDEYLDQFLFQYGSLEDVEGEASAGDFVQATIDFSHDGKPLHTISDLTIQIKPTLRFQDAELEGFDALMAGVKKDDSKETDLTISAEAESIEMRGETVSATFHVAEVKQMQQPELTKEFLEQLGVETEEALRQEVQKILERQVTYQQRQTARTQMLEKITDSADWDLPEELVSRQVENALHRETLEMQQAGFTTQEIQARENELRQSSVSSTRQAMKEHFILDKIANDEEIDVSPSDIEMEIQMMAMQRGESPRRLRARLQKSGVIENLEAQIRERKAVDILLEKAQYVDVPMDRPEESDVEAVNRSVCVSITSVDSTGEDEEEETDE